MPGWMKYNLKSRLPGEISIISDMLMTPQLCMAEVPPEESEKGG